MAGWPTDKWEGYRHSVYKDQLDRASAEPLAILDQWLRGERSDVPGFNFHGPVGRGKTAVALILALRAARRGCSAQFTTAEDVAQDRSSTAYSSRDGETQTGLRSRLVAPQVLILDDVCTRQYSGNERGFILNLIRVRQGADRLTMLTTNLELNKNTGTAEKPRFEDRETFERYLDGRVLSTYKGWSHDARQWGPSLRGKDDSNAGGQSDA